MRSKYGIEDRLVLCRFRIYELLFNSIYFVSQTYIHSKLSKKYLECSRKKPSSMTLTIIIFTLPEKLQKGTINQFLLIGSSAIHAVRLYAIACWFSLKETCNID